MNARAAVAVLVLGAALAACGSADNGSEPAAGAGSPAAAAAGDATSAGTARAIDICTVLGAATAARLSGQPYTTAVAEKGEWQSHCAYNNDDATAEGVNVSIADTNVDTTWEAVHTGGVSDISGLGDKAFWDNENTLYVVAGAELIQVNGLQDEAKSRALVKPILDALH